MFLSRRAKLAGASAKIANAAMRRATKFHGEPTNDHYQMVLLEALVVFEEHPWPTLSVTSSELLESESGQMPEASDYLAGYAAHY
ncbi:hypothetical protein NGI10_03635 [Raoultella ornithinolytica]|uniref:hypothetical protein n=1 Tax=Raoultella ornithinolytica TaxID=54291 RepID=UPI002DB9B3FA|nr:hypothetical protein [Raoultella ornithinolytica]MEB8212218.1 hypothetical protein [Raoultella ornithinolytica]